MILNAWKFRIGTHACAIGGCIYLYRYALAKNSVQLCKALNYKNFCITLTTRAIAFIRSITITLLTITWFCIHSRIVSPSI